jgi:VWFA-related protein
MKKYSFVLCLLLTSLCLLIPGVAAQSNRGGNQSNKKANQRKKEPAKKKPEFSNEEQKVINQDTFETDEDIIEIDTSLVTIPVRVLDRNGRFISGLEKKDFKVFEDKTEQEIAYFTNEQKPFTVALILDMSYSTTFKIDEIQQAALQFVTELRPEDKVMVLSFDEEIHVLCEPTNDRKILNSAIVRTNISTGTSLYEAVDFVINKRFNKIQGRKAIVLFTDGVDTTSARIGDRNNLRDASELDALIYPIHYDTFADVQAIENGKIKIKDPNSLPSTTPPIGGGQIPTGGTRNPLPIPFPTGTIGGRGSQPRSIPNGSGTTLEEYKKGEEYLNEMAIRTGGRVYEAKSASGLNRAFSNIASELREFYSLGYYPDDEKEAGKTRKIKVRVNREKVAVKARSSYIVKKKDEKNN